MRVRFAPSPTGALHIGGVRTALYNYLLAKKHGGDFLLRIEDTDQTRYVMGAEEYIMEALEWLGFKPDEGPRTAGKYGPYRQSERKSHYENFARKLIEQDKAYYAFDTPEELSAKREEEKAKGNHAFKYNAEMRMQMRNSVSLSAEETQALLDSKTPFTIRLKVPVGETVIVNDIIRGEVRFSSDELDDKVMLKTDGMPTYHLANIVDDHLMGITHVIRGEEWLPSTAHHVLLYQAFGWKDTMPQFAHLPLILKPNGKGKLSKRDGAKLGIPVFPLSWNSPNPDDSFEGFREFGFLPEAVINFLAFLGWNPGTEQELFSLDELIESFSLEKVSKSGARFDFQKALWYNQQYIIKKDNKELAKLVRPYIEEAGHQPDDAYLEQFCGMMKERVSLLPEFWTEGYYFFESVKEYTQKDVKKKWKPERRPFFEALIQELQKLSDFSATSVKATVVQLMEANELSFGAVLPILRLSVAGTMKGPDAFEMMSILGSDEVAKRIALGMDAFDAIKSAS